MNCENVFTELKLELISIHRQVNLEETSVLKDSSKRLKCIKKIETVIEEIVENVSKGKAPAFKTIVHSNWDNCFFDGRVKLREMKRKLRHVNFGRLSSRRNFTTIVFLLSKIHKLLTTQQTSTRRELYYENLDMFRSQKEVDSGMRDICYILNEPTWELRVMATSNGIVCGPLTLTLTNGELLDCSRQGGISIPTDVLDIEKMSTSALWVLIVEKDAAFQKLISSEASSRLGPCIFVTGKGFPDVNTRILICKFWEHLQIPILALVDADPAGFEIMCVYRFGSMTMSSYSGHLACPAVRWLGVHPSDIQPLLLDTKSLSLREVQKTCSLLKRCYVKQNLSLKSQLEILLEGNAKAEIEGVSSISSNYLTDVYMRNKIQCKEYF